MDKVYDWFFFYWRGVVFFSKMDWETKIGYRLVSGEG
jgi:hypothetical protein